MDIGNCLIFCQNKITIDHRERNSGARQHLKGPNLEIILFEPLDASKFAGLCNP